MARPTVGSSQNLRVPIATGALFSVAKIRDGLKAIRDVHGEHGYFDIVSPETECDRIRKSIHLTIGFDEGGQFRVPKVLILAS